MENQGEAAPDLADPTAHKKHQAMIDRLSKSHQTRLQNSLARKSESNSSSSSLESTSSFLSRFSHSKCSIDSQLAHSKLTSDPSRLKSHLEQISVSISDLEKLVAENSYYLPSYEVRSSLKTISELKLNLENLNSQLLPKKKFTFKNKATKQDQITDAKETGIVESDAKLPEKTSFVIPDLPGFRNVKGEVLVKNFEGLEIGEFMLSDLDSCEVRLVGSVRAIFVHKLKNCRVFSGPVTGSILIEEVEGCMFVLASHQIRIHYAKGSDFYLRVRSRPIIEDCSGVRFAPYCLRYDRVEEDLREAALDEETGNWGNVDDFRWLRAVQSPNWSVLPENEWVSVVNISNLESGTKEN